MTKRRNKVPVGERKGKATGPSPTAEQAARWSERVLARQAADARVAAKSSPEFAPRPWAEFFALLANLSEPVDALGHEMKLKAGEVEERDAAVRRWRELRGPVDEGVPTAAVLRLVERHRVLIRSCIEVLLGLDGQGVLEVIDEYGLHIARLPGEFHAELVDRVNALKLEDADKISVQMEVMAESQELDGLRLLGGEVAEINLWFLAIALRKKVVFRRCKHCQATFFCDGRPARYCGGRCRVAAWRKRAKKRPEVAARLRAQTRRRVVLHRTRKRAGRAGRSE